MTDRRQHTYPPLNGFSVEVAAENVTYSAYGALTDRVVAWLIKHVGERYHEWGYTSFLKGRASFWFLDAAHAAAFKERWGDGVADS